MRICPFPASQNRQHHHLIINARQQPANSEKTINPIPGSLPTATILLTQVKLSTVSVLFFSTRKRLSLTYV